MSYFRNLILALAALVAVGLSSQARADEGYLRITFVKAGWIIGGTVGRGILTLHGHNYPVSVGGISYGFTFGGSETYLQGKVANIFRPQDINGIYAAGSAGAAIIRGPQAVVLTNQNGVVLTLAGGQTGLIVNLDLSGLALTLQ